MGKSANARRLLDKARIDLDDICIFQREAFRVLAWLNPIHRQIVAFSETCGGIQESASGQVRADTIEGALAKLDLDSPQPTDFEEMLFGFAREVLSTWHDTVNKAHPVIRERLPVLKDPEKVEKSLRKSVGKSLRSGDSHLNEMRTKLAHLRDSFGTFSDITTRSDWSWFHQLTDTALTIMGHPHMATARSLLRNAVNSVDNSEHEAFLKGYYRCIDRLCECSAQRSQAIEDALDIVVMKLLAASQKLGQLWMERLGELADSGVDVEPVLNELVGPPEVTDPDYTMFCEKVLTALRERRLVDIRAENNLRSVRTMRSPFELVSAPSTPHIGGSVLLHDARSGYGARHQECVALITQAVSGLDGTGVYLTPTIPHDKLANACSSYANCPSEEILFLYDSTVWGGAKEGLCLTDTRLLLKCMGEKPRTRKLASISKVTVKKAKGFFGSPNVVVDRLEIEVSDLETAQCVSRAILAARDYARKVVKEQKMKEKVVGK